jgi:hypothetical protein
MTNAPKVGLSFCSSTGQRHLAGRNISSDEFNRELRDVRGDHRLWRPLSREPVAQGVAARLALASAVVGPVLFAAFRRLAAIWIPTLRWDNCCPAERGDTVQRPVICSWGNRRVFFTKRTQSR